ncbi:TynA protein [Paenibacillus mucilaginosus]|uniref:TynA n=1 Tax=Paenibacillus mucilaginosus (strain KNP414) TaxID=1036673 RepID=F8FIQ8_PAEMK|nr:TynA protein [Paenibacillus mucilaginosus]AEI45512.1 TynA [Paenibacillus mucilaginosus KNP414]MCG7215268.1 hypothetical protein [Paenibacillus mucilaginosus]WDM26935.1 hypothetical protein KCX80_31760 [Paenibacillus mucilaginosus]
MARAEEWPIMPTEWVHAMLKPWNFFDETPTLDLPAAEREDVRTAAVRSTSSITIRRPL